MPRPLNPFPTYLRHKPTNQAVCTIRLPNGQRKDLYLGRWKPAYSKTEYARIVALVSANDGIYPDAPLDLTVHEALVRYVRHIDASLIGPDGSLLPSVEPRSSGIGNKAQCEGSDNVRPDW
jgi:hypothetical protein